MKVWQGSARALDIRLKLTLVGAMLIGACGSRLEGTDSSTHWLDTCDEDRDCGSGLTCECGSCTRACDSTRACDGLGDATCATARCGGAAVLVCAESCNNDSECGDGECLDGACTLALQCAGSSCQSSDDASTTPDTSDSHESDAETESSTTQDPDLTCEGSNCSADATAPSEEDSDPSDGDVSETVCPAMDVEDTGDECLGSPASYWNGAECVTVTWCSCQGEDCADMFAYVDACRSHYAACIEDVPECPDEMSQTEDTVLPNVDVFTFSVMGEEPGQYEEDPGLAPLADFTEAEWRGTEGSDTEPGDAGPPPRSLTFLVAGETHTFDFDFGNLDRPLPEIAGLDVGTPVLVRVVRSAGAPVQLQVQDTSGVPLFWFVQSGSGGNTTDWTFGDLSARVGAPTCKLIDTTCNWLFTANELVVGYQDYEAVVPPQQNVYVGAPIGQGPSFSILNSYDISGNGPAYAGDVCAAEIPREDGFVLWRDDERDDDM